MNRTFDKTQTGSRCLLCGKGNVMGFNRPHSLKRTKRVVHANIQSYHGLPACTRCLRTLRNNDKKAEKVEA